VEEAFQSRLAAIQQAVEALREDERHHRALVESSADGIVIVTGAAVVFVNKAFLTLHGLTDASQALGRIDQLILPEDKERVMEWIFARQRGESLSNTYEYRIRRPDGEIRTVQTVLTTITYKGQPAEMGVIRDITETKLTETALRASEQLLAGILETAAEAIISIDEAHRITMFNQGAERIFGYSAKEMVGKPLDLLLPERFREVHRQHVRNFAAAPEKARRIAEGLQVFGCRKDGSEFPAEASISKLNLRDGTMFTVIFWDITERKEAEKELKKSREELRGLAARLQQAREEERSRLARAIHDELSGALSALNMELSLLPGRVTQDLHQLLAQKASSMSELIDRMQERVREIATELRPAVLDQLGLIAAIEWQSQQFQRRSGIQCEVALPDEEIPLDRERSTAVFRIFQEALTNIALHAQASKATINVKKEDGSLILEVEDNGKGIQQSEIFDVKSLGLLGMRERALAFGGELQISGAPRQGTLVKLKMPIG
jgi:PAS domain S-box-containing protein